MKIDVAEMYSPPRVTTEANRMGLRAGEAFDLTNGWDFTRESHRQKAERYVDEEQPLVIIGSPPCTPFCRLQSFSPESERKKAKLAEGIEHMKSWSSYIAYK